MKSILIAIALLAGGYFYFAKVHYTSNQNKYLDNYLANEDNSSAEEDELFIVDTNDYDSQIIQNKRVEESSPKKTVSSQKDRELNVNYGAYEESDSYTCDGRKQCKQMHSCLEAKFFLANCPGVEMDKNRNGVPCENKLCGGGIF